VIVFWALSAATEEMTGPAGDGGNNRLSVFSQSSQKARDSGRIPAAPLITI
jgi:hypothetical protein